MFAGVLRHFAAVLEHRGRSALNIINVAKPTAFRTLGEVLAAGYEVKQSLDSPFSRDETKLVVGALKQ